MSGNSREQRV